ncbi:MAG: bifunctional diaminohydroxyphosphoribosylaminopyrimidine deaminase/5-amino-6-(5-phosphoribosylamino)uracil reductase RibD, partial [Candidatus Altiarchaeota archaeon]
MKDEEYMRKALELSLKGRPTPNPYVGAVLVRGGRIISEGYHRKAGMPHAEVEALKGVDARGATLYVTLEPCSHYGRTPPCTKAIIAAGVSEVVYAVDDPTEKVRGREELIAAGIKVRRGVLKGECERANEVFLKHARTGRPFIVLKTAMTVDGQIATSTGESKWITSEESRRHAHGMRGRYDAVLVGINTVLRDNPRLTCRVKGGKDPLRVVFDSRLRIPLNANVLKGRNAVIATSEKYNRQKMKLVRRKAEVLVVGRSKVDIVKLMKKLGERGVTSVLIEGGGIVNAAAAKAGIVDKYLFYIAPKLMGGQNTPAFRGGRIKRLDEAVKLKFESVKQIG